MAKELNKELQQCGWMGACLSEEIYGVKVSTGSLASWEFPDSTAQPTLFSHSLILLFCQKYVLPREEWLSSADAAFDKVFSACSTSQSLSPSQLLTQMLKFLVDSKIWVNKRIAASAKASFWSILLNDQFPAIVRLHQSAHSQSLVRKQLAI